MTINNRDHAHNAAIRTVRHYAAKQPGPINASDRLPSARETMQTESLRPEAVALDDQGR